MILGLGVDGKRTSSLSCRGRMVQARFLTVPCPSGSPGLECGGPIEETTPSRPLQPCAALPPVPSGRAPQASPLSQHPSRALSFPGLILTSLPPCLPASCM